MNDDKHFWKKLLLGQALSIGAALTSITSEKLERSCGRSITAIPTLALYGFLWIFSSAFYSKTTPIRLSNIDLFWIFVGAGLDVAANLFIFLSFAYAPLAQISLLEDAAIPCAFILDFLIFTNASKNDKNKKATSNWKTKAFGAGLCTAGLTFYSIMTYSRSKESSWNLLTGILLPLASAASYASSNAIQCWLQEKHLGRNFRCWWYLGKLAPFGFLWSTILGLPFFSLEYQAIIDAKESVVSNILLLVIIVFILTLFYWLTPWFLTLTVSATFFNMSLMTKTFYCLSFSILFLKEPLQWFAVFSLSIVTVSLFIYNWANKRIQ